jgi:hypothetical protein
MRKRTTAITLAVERERSIPQITKDPNSKDPGLHVIQASADFEEKITMPWGLPSISIFFFTVSWPVTQVCSPFFCAKNIIVREIVTKSDHGMRHAIYHQIDHLDLEPGKFQAY